MGKVKQIKIKNQTYYFYNDKINLKNFDSNLVKIDKKIYKGTDIYYIGYIAIEKIDDCENIYSGNKYLVFDDSVNESKKILKTKKIRRCLGSN